MHLREYLNITHNVNCLWHYLCEKKIICSEIKYPRCKKTLIFNSTVENKILHCTAKYYKTIKGRKRQKLTCNFKISIFHGLNVYTQIFLKYVNLSHILEMSILRHNSSTWLSIYYE